MADEEDDIKALVFNEEIPESTYFSGEQVTEYGSTRQATPGQLSTETFSSAAEQSQEFIIAVFVVSFDTRKGLVKVSFVRHSLYMTNLIFCLYIGNNCTKTV